MATKLLKQNELDKQRFAFSDLAITLLCCFAVPFLAMILLYTCVKVWPAGEHSVLILDLNAQYIYYFEELREILTGSDSIIYSFNRNLGGEFLGIFAYYLSSPFSLIVALFPKNMITEALYLILVLKTGFCGLTFGYYLEKTRKMNRVHTIMFSAMYALSAYVIVLQHNVMWLDNVLAFPLILYAVDQIIISGKYKLFVISVAYCLMSNFYIGYMTCFFIVFWFFIRYFMLTPEERNPRDVDFHFARALLRVIIAAAVAVMISAVIILPVYYSLSFGKLEFSNPDYTPKQIFDFIDILTKTFFGSYDTVRPEGMPFLYCGTLALVIAPLYFFSKNIPTRRKIGFLVIMLFLAVSFNFNILDYIWHGFQRPNWLNARFAYMFIGLMLIMAADAFRNLSEIGAKPVMTSAILWCGTLLILDKFGYENLPDFAAVWCSLLFLAITAAAVPAFIKSANNSRNRRITSVTLCCLVIAELLLNGVIMLGKLDEDVVFSTRESYRSVIDKYLTAVDTFDEDPTLYRAEKLVHRTKNDAMALDINGMTNSTSTLNARVIKLLAQFGYASRSHWSYYAGSTAPTDALFGVKYIMTDPSASTDIPTYIYDLYELYATTEDGIEVYKNPYALSIAFSSGADVLQYDLPIVDPNAQKGGIIESVKALYKSIFKDNEKDEEEEEKVETPTKAYVDPFTYMNELYSAILGREVTIWTEVTLENTKDTGCKRVTTTGHKGYKPDGSGSSSKVTYTISIDSDKTVYAYFPSSYPRKATLYVDGVKQGYYFDSKDFSIKEIGTYEAGETVTVDLQLTTDSLYIRNDAHFFWYFDEEAYLEAVAEIAKGSMDAYSKVDHKITGTVNVPEGDSVMLTTIPYDAGWEIKVDGKKVETVPVLEDTLLAFAITPGEHTIEMTYKASCLINGLLISIGGILIFAAVWVAESLYIKKRKKNGTYVRQVYPHPDCNYADDEYYYSLIPVEDIGDDETEIEIEFYIDPEETSEIIEENEKTPDQKDEE
ncbi:MAG: YfhO family protein [Clostridia bacterium]|nr:YfhO family protein [Clostridia bacterium]